MSPQYLTQVNIRQITNAQILSTLSEKPSINNDSWIGCCFGTPPVGLHNIKYDMHTPCYGSLFLLLCIWRDIATLYLSFASILQRYLLKRYDTTARSTVAQDREAIDLPCHER